MSLLREFLAGSEWANYKKWRAQRSRFAPVAIRLEVSANLMRFALQQFRTRLRQKLKIGKRSPMRPAFQKLFADPSLLTAQAVISHFSTRPKPSYLWSEADLPKLKEIALERFADDVERLKSQAEKIKRGVFPLVSGIEFDGSGELNWQHPFDDPEHLFYLNRWYHGITLAKAYFYTQDESYAEHFVKLLGDWAEHNPVDPASRVWESYSVTERIANWIFAYHLLSGSKVFQKPGLLLLLGLLSEHAHYLSEHLEVKENHNHLMNNGRALFEVGLLFPELRNASGLADMGWQILTREMKRQFRQDGMLGEQSVHYHLLLLRTYLEVSLLARRNGRLLDEQYLETLDRMHKSADAFIRADGSIPMIGDLSPDSDVKSLVGLMFAGATQFGFKISHHLSEHGLWYSRPSEVIIPPDPVHPRLSYLPESGYAIVMTRNLHLTFGCDPRARIIRHGHADVLGLNLWIQGQPLLVDGGNYSYGKREWEQYFRGPYAHSLTVVDELPPYILPGYQQVLLPADYLEAEAAIVECVERDGIIYLEGYHTGYRRLEAPATVRRQIWVATDNWIFIRDSVEGPGKRQVEVLYQLGDCGFDKGLVSCPGGHKLAFFKFRSDCLFEVTQFRAQQDPEIRGWAAPAYGVKQPATTLSCRMSGVGDTNFETLIWLNPGSEPVWPEDLTN